MASDAPRRVQLGPKQLEALQVLAVPYRVMLSDNATIRSLEKRGLVRCDGLAVCITSAGLGALADAMDAGQIKDGLMQLAERKAEKENANAE